MTWAMLHDNFWLAYSWLYNCRKPNVWTIRCLVCDGTAPGDDQCGCGGWQSVEEALITLEQELEILCK